MTEMLKTETMSERIENINKILEERKEKFRLEPAPELPYVTMAGTDFNCCPRIKLTDKMMEETDEYLADYTSRVFSENAKNIDASKFIDPDFVIANVMPRLDPYWSRPLLEKDDIAYKEWLNLLVSYYIVPSGLELDEDSNPYIRITRSLLDVTGLNEDQLHNAAIENINNTVTVRSITDVLNDLMGDTPGMPAPEADAAVPMLVITNTKTQYGAAALLSDKILQTVSDKMGKKYVILPSSVHEILATRYLEDGCEENYRNMIREVNDSQVLPEERLGYEPYIWSEGNLTVA